MPRRETPFVADYTYPIYNCGNNRGGIFLDDENYLSPLNTHAYDPSPSNPLNRSYPSLTLIYHTANPIQPF